MIQRPTIGAYTWSWERVVLLTLGVAVLHLLGVFVLGVTNTAQAVAAPLAMLFGPMGVFAAAVGVILAEASATGVSPYPVIAAVDATVCGLIAFALWQTAPHTLTLSRGVRIFTGVMIAIVASLIAVGIALVAFSLLAGLTPLAIVQTLLVDRLVIAVFATGILIGFAPVVDRPRQTPSIRSWLASLSVLGVIGLGWVIGAVIFSLISRDLAAFPAVATAIDDALPATVGAFVLAATGEWGWAALLVGSVIGIALVVIIHRFGLAQAHEGHS